MNFDRLVEISRALKGQAQTGRAFHTTFILKNGKILSLGLNNYNKTHPRTAHYHSKYFNNRGNYQACLHSEISSLIRLGEVDDYSRYTFVNVRIRNDGKIGNSKPCNGCGSTLKLIRPKVVYYSTDDEEFAEFEF